MQKIKLFIESDVGKDILVVLVVILVGLGSFELGRLSKSANSGGLKVEYPAGLNTQSASAISAINTTNASNTTLSTNSQGRAYFASSRGSKYYPVGCAGGKSIKQENRIYFATADKAEAAGYELSSTCQ